MNNLPKVEAETPVKISETEDRDIKLTREELYELVFEQESPYAEDVGMEGYKPWLR